MYLVTVLDVTLCKKLPSIDSTEICEYHYKSEIRVFFVVFNYAGVGICIIMYMDPMCIYILYYLYL